MRDEQKQTPQDVCAAGKLQRRRRIRKSQFKIKCVRAALNVFALIPSWFIH